MRRGRPVPQRQLPRQQIVSVKRLSLPQASGMSLAGKAMLGIAGAYLLRAVAESSSLPRLGVAAIASAYAMLWLVPGGARAGRRMAWASITYACHLRPHFAPMLWELTLPLQRTACRGHSSAAGRILYALPMSWPGSATSPASSG